jgi:hypothetical protein
MRRSTPLLLAENRHVNSFVHRFCTLDSCLIRNESNACYLTLSHALTRAHVEGRPLNSGYLTLSHACRKRGASG